YKDDLTEHGGELNNQTKRELIKARAEIEAGKFHTLAQVKKEQRILYKNYIPDSLSTASFTNS
ncbi:MAG: hypothetical protein MIO93_00980, partial [ANME-2 cluster archaeon]|nr:hypothetical protein [ANME-2 cluster archaeon]